MTKLDVIVVGADTPASRRAWAAARLGCRRALHALDGHCCAHALQSGVGGTAKGHLGSSEIDALGGVDGQAIDATGLQFKLLNRSRGPAVWSPRAQADRAILGAGSETELRIREPNIEWILGRAGECIVHDGQCHWFGAGGRQAASLRSLMITTGTFLNGLIHIGRDQRPAGRAGEPPSKDLAESMKSFGFRVGPIQDGYSAPARAAIHRFRGGVNRAVFHVEHGDPHPDPFSFLATLRPENPCVCHLLHTTERCTPRAGAYHRVSPLQRTDFRNRSPLPSIT